MQVLPVRIYNHKINTTPEIDRWKPADIIANNDKTLFCLKGCSHDKLAKLFGRSKVVQGCMNFYLYMIYVYDLFNEFNFTILPGRLIPLVNCLCFLPMN